MHHAEIARVFEASGPFVSLYLATERDVEQAAERVARWSGTAAPPGRPWR